MSENDLCFPTLHSKLKAGQIGAVHVSLQLMAPDTGITGRLGTSIMKDRWLIPW